MKNSKIISKIGNSLLWLFWDFLGFRLIWEKIKTPIDDKSLKRKTISFFLLSIGVYSAIFGIASQRYENAIDKIENRANAILAQLGSNKSALGRISTVKNMDCPYKPKFWNPPSLAKSLLFKNQDGYPEMVELLSEVFQIWKGELKGVNFKKADLREMDLSYANLSEADLSDADLSYTKLNGAVMRDTIFLNTQLDGADLAFAVIEKARKLTSCQILETINWGKAILPENIKLSIDMSEFELDHCMFITNREPILENENKTIFSFERYLASQDVFFIEVNNESEFVEIGSAQFFRKISESNVKHIVFYIHDKESFLKENVLYETYQLQKLFDERSTNAERIKVIPLVWPAEYYNDDFWEFQKAADASAFAFSRFFEMIMKWRGDNEEEPCMNRVSVLADSMGSRLLRESIKAWAKYERNYNLPIIFRNIFLVAPDIVNSTLEKGKDGNLLAQCSRNVSVYFADDDNGLERSFEINLENKISNRLLGRTGPENIDKIPKNVYSINCDDINNKYDALEGHKYFLYNESQEEAGLVFDHIYNSIITGRVKVEPQGSRYMILKEDK